MYIEQGPSVMGLDKAKYGKSREATMSVGFYPEGASYYGLYNMARNVFEWVSDSGSNNR